MLGCNCKNPLFNLLHKSLKKHPQSERGEKKRNINFLAQISQNIPNSREEREKKKY
jgi:hypothetical protein